MPWRARQPFRPPSSAASRPCHWIGIDEAYRRTPPVARVGKHQAKAWLQCVPQVRDAERVARKENLYGCEEANA